MNSSMPEPAPLGRRFAQLFSAVGCVGCGATQTPPFRTPADYVAHLDRLGVTHSLVHHAVARDQSPTSGNAQLLEELGACPGAVGRLFPAFGVTPTQVWERGGVAALRRVMLASGSSALRAFPVTMSYRLYQLDALLHEIIDLRPLLTVNIRDVSDASDLLLLAGEFPSLPVICTEVTWPSLTTVFDLMRRCPNILLETSWLHVDGVIRDAVRHFGAHRVVFGLGPPEHQAAAIAALAHAGLSDQDQQRVAFGNLMNCMGKDAGLVPSAMPRSDTQERTPTLWSDFLHGHASSTSIIDAHSHFGPLALWCVHEQDTDRQIEQALVRMDRLGIGTMIVSGLDALFSDPARHNLALADKLRPHGDRFRQYFVFNPFYEDRLLPLMQECLADPHFVGFKLLNDYWGIPVTDARFAPVWKFADAHRLPILLHTWDSPLNSPAMLRDIVPQHPGATFLLGHSGGGNRGRREAEQLAIENPNVCLEWCGSFCCSIPWEETLARVDRSQVVFGTDGIYHDTAWELGRLLSLRVPDEYLKPILGDNMRRILSRRLF